MKSEYGTRGTCAAGLGMKLLARSSTPNPISTRLMMLNRRFGRLSS